MNAVRQTYLPRNTVLVFFGPILLDCDECNAVSRVNAARLMSLWRARRLPLLHVERPSGVALTAVSGDIHPEPGENVMRSGSTDVFRTTGLRGQLRREGLNCLLLVGDNTENSIGRSAISAGKFGFEAYVVSDGISGNKISSKPPDETTPPVLSLPMLSTNDVIMNAPPEICSCR